MDKLLQKTFFKCDVDTSFHSLTLSLKSQRHNPKFKLNILLLILIQVRTSFLTIIMAVCAYCFKYRYAHATTCARCGRKRSGKVGP